jgi:VWFA-related protein
MNIANATVFRLLLVIITGIAFVSVASAQERDTKQSPEQAEDVVRINTELVQTDVAVVDKRGRFVDGLRPEQFELRVDGKPQAISFFERVMAGSPEEERQLTTERSRVPASQIKVGALVNRKNRARLIFFFVDDVHLASENLARARQALLRFVNNEMREDDQVAVVSASGQIGFLQQMTNNKAVLREAISRLEYKRNPEVNAGPASISEYDANQVEAGNRELFRYLVGAIARSGSTNPAGTVISRARQVNATARFDTASTLGMLESLMRLSAPLPGRKVVFFISDGFITDARQSGVLDSLRRVTATAARVGAVIYTMDARGTFADANTDASKNPYPDFTGSVSRNIFAEESVTREPLRILADDTGGQAILNSNSFEDGFKRALHDSSGYYLLAWRPEREEFMGEKARIRVSIKGRPDLKVRVRRGFIESFAASTTKKESNGKSVAAESAESALLAALGSIYPVQTLPLALSVGYMNTPDKGMVLTASMQIEAATLNDSASTETQKAEVDVIGVALNDRGSIYSFKQQLSVPAASVPVQGQQAIVWNQQLPISPGLYQVRVAVRERQSGRTGSAMQWIEIPRITAENFSMSSIFIGERKAGDSAASVNVPLNVERRLSRSSRLRYQTYFYNAARRAGAPDVVVRVQILRDGQPVMVMSQGKLAVSGATDLARISFSGEIALERLPAGRYVLHISASDKESGKSIAQQTDFIVE